MLGGFLIDLGGGVYGCFVKGDDGDKLGVLDS